MTFYDSVGPNVNQADENKLVRTALTSLPEPFLSGLKLEGQIEINGLTLNTIDNDDVVWVVTDIEGWWTLPDSEVPDLPRGWGDGSYDAIGRWANRLITLNGSFLPQRPEDAPAARNKLLNALSPLLKSQEGGYLIVNEDGVTKKSAKVRLSGTPQITSVNARGRHDFSIGLKAVDPIKYEYVDGNPDGYNYVDIVATQQMVDDETGIPIPNLYGNDEPVTNSGNTPVPVIIELSSFNSIPNSDDPPAITNLDTDQTIFLIGAVASNHKLEIDTYNREALDVTYSGSATTNIVNGRAKLSVLVDWIYLNPGENTIFITNFPQNTSCRILWKSGWIG